MSPGGVSETPWHRPDWTGLMERVGASITMLELVVIPAGTFRMGSPDGSRDERPVHDVAVTEPFAVGVYEVTHGEHDEHRSMTPTLRQPVRGEPALPAPAETLADHPVTGVTWSEAAAYADWLSLGTGYQYRLPSEAEWEYVASAGIRTRYPFGDDPRDLCRHANVADQTLEARYRKYSTVACDDGVLGAGPVGRLEASALGVHDMLGNAEEWVADGWRRNYRNYKAAPTARRGPTTRIAAHTRFAAGPGTQRPRRRP